jgi:hypothetical protein
MISGRVLFVLDYEGGKSYSEYICEIIISGRYYDVGVKTPL